MREKQLFLERERERQDYTQTFYTYLDSFPKIFWVAWILKRVGSGKHDVESHRARPDISELKNERNNFLYINS